MEKKIAGRVSTSANSESPVVKELSVTEAAIKSDLARIARDEKEIKKAGWDFDPFRMMRS